MKRVVIVGGGGTGDYAAFTLRKRGFDGEITILSADRDRPYDRPYLSKEFLRGEIEPPKVFRRGESDYAKERIELHLEQHVTGGSLTERRLTVAGGDDVSFDVLVLGLGGTPRRLPGIPDAENVLTLRSLGDSKAIREALGHARRLLLIGAGFIGAEVAASARKLGKEVLLVEALPVPLQRALGSEVGEIYAAIHRDQGVDVRTDTKVESWHTDGNRVTGVTLSGGKDEEADLVLVAVGIEPNLDLPRGLGLPIEGGGVARRPRGPFVLCLLSPRWARRGRAVHERLEDQRGGWQAGGESPPHGSIGAGGHEQGPGRAGEHDDLARAAPSPAVGRDFRINGEDLGYAGWFSSGSSQGSASDSGRTSVLACSLPIRLPATSPSAAMKAASSAL